MLREAGLRARRRGALSPPTAWSPRFGPARCRGHRRRAGALGVAGPRPRATMLHTGGSNVPRTEGPHRTGLVTSRWRKSFGSAVLRRQRWPPVVPDDWRRTLQVERGERGEWGPWIGRGEARRAAHRGKGGERQRWPNPDGRWGPGAWERCRNVGSGRRSSALVADERRTG
jgi:hypothetical protein